MVWADRATALALLSLVAVIWRQAGELPGSADAFPKAAAGAIGVLALILLARSFIPKIAGRNDGEGQPTVRSMVLPLTAFVILAAGTYAMRLVGFFPAALAIGGGIFLLLGVQRYVLYWTMFISALVLIHVGFAWLLGVPLWSPRAFSV